MALEIQWDPGNLNSEGNEIQFEVADNSRYRGKFQSNFDQEKENLVRVGGDVRFIEVLSCTSVNTYNRLQNSPYRIFAYSSAREQSNKRWNEAENRGQDLGETTAIGGSSKGMYYTGIGNPRSYL